MTAEFCEPAVIGLIFSKKYIQELGPDMGNQAENKSGPFSKGELIMPDEMRIGRDRTAHIRRSQGEDILYFALLVKIEFEAGIQHPSEPSQLQFQVVGVQLYRVRLVHYVLQYCNAATRCSSAHLESEYSLLCNSVITAPGSGAGHHKADSICPL